MKKIKLTFLSIMVMLSLTLTACSSGVEQSLYDDKVKECEAVQSQLESIKSEYSVLEGELESLSEEAEINKKKADDTAKELESVQKEYSNYKESMAEYEGLAAAEAESRKLIAESEAAAEKARRQAEEEAKRAAAESEAAAEAARLEAEAKRGYDTGITYNQLARTPDDYIGEKVKFKGKVLQVIEGSSEVDIRLAVNNDYNNVIYVVYDKSIVKSRVLEDDKITVYGISGGLYSYQSTLGGTITIPLVIVEKIEQ
mgnify:CR=1 FL=1